MSFFFFLSKQFLILKNTRSVKYMHIHILQWESDCKIFKMNDLENHTFSCFGGGKRGSLVGIHVGFPNIYHKLVL